jgi:hypothetical protein
MLFCGGSALAAKRRVFGNFRTAVGTNGKFLSVGPDLGLNRLFLNVLALLLLATFLHY